MTQKEERRGQQRRGEREEKGKKTINKSLKIIREGESD